MARRTVLPSTDRPSGTDRPAGRPRSSGGPGRKADSRTGRSGRRKAVLGSVLAAAAIGLGSLLVQPFTDSTSPDSTAQRPGDAAQTFSGQHLEKQVTDLLAEGHSTDPRAGTVEPFRTASGDEPSGASSDAPRALVDPLAGLPDCVREGVGSSEEAIATKPGTYQGKDAFLVLLPDRSDSSRVVAYVVDASCANQSSSAPGAVLFKESYTR